MSWRDLLRALDEEAAREIEALRASAARDAERILAEAQRELDAERAAALARAREEAEAMRRRALSGAQRDRARAVLAERRRMLEEVRAEALDRVRREGSRALQALTRSLAADVGDAASTWMVDPAGLEAVRDLLEREHPATLARAELRAAAEPTGGIEVVVGRRVLDATAASRLARTWPDAEPDVARLLFGGGA